MPWHPRLRGDERWFSAHGGQSWRRRASSVRLQGWGRAKPESTIVGWQVRHGKAKRGCLSSGDGPVSPAGC